MRRKLTHGVGLCDVRGVSTKLPSYRRWSGMLERCYNSKSLSRFPTYTGCSVCEEWLTFSNFKRWHDDNYREGYHMDKDILVQGNKVYGPETCCFVPGRINTMLTDRHNARGNYPLGVTQKVHINKDGSRAITYPARCWGADRKHMHKTFKTPEEAQAWYAETKHAVVCEVAQRALDAGEIGQDVFDALVARMFVDMSACRARGGR